MKTSAAAPVLRAFAHRRAHHRLHRAQLRQHGGEQTYLRQPAVDDANRLLERIRSSREVRHHHTQSAAATISHIHLAADDPARGFETARRPPRTAARTSRAMTHSTAAWFMAPPSPEDHVVYIMKRSVGADSPMTVTLDSMSRSPPARRAGQSRLMMMTQVPVRDDVNRSSPVMR